MLCDDAPQFNWITAEMGLCWVHEGRYYKKLMPVFVHHLTLLSGFRKQFRDFYDELLAYQQQPSPEEAARLEGELDRLFSTSTGYNVLDTRIAKTRAKKDSLLTVLRHSEIPLHNNPVELSGLLPICASCKKIRPFRQRANTEEAGIWPICGIGGILGGVGAEGKGKVNDRIGGFA